MFWFVVLHNLYHKICMHHQILKASPSFWLFQVRRIFPLFWMGRRVMPLLSVPGSVLEIKVENCWLESDWKVWTLAQFFNFFRLLFEKSSWMVAESWKWYCCLSLLPAKNMSQVFLRWYNNLKGLHFVCWFRIYRDANTLSGVPC